VAFLQDPAGVQGGKPKQAFHSAATGAGSPGVKGASASSKKKNAQIKADATIVSRASPAVQGNASAASAALPARAPVRATARPQEQRSAAWRDTSPDSDDSEISAAPSAAPSARSIQSAAVPPAARYGVGILWLTRNNKLIVRPRDRPPARPPAPAAHRPPPTPAPRAPLEASNGASQHAEMLLGSSLGADGGLRPGVGGARGRREARRHPQSGRRLRRPAPPRPAPPRPAPPHHDPGHRVQQPERCFEGGLAACRCARRRAKGRARAQVLAMTADAAGRHPAAELMVGARGSEVELTLLRVNAAAGGVGGESPGKVIKRNGAAVSRPDGQGQGAGGDTKLVQVTVRLARLLAAEALSAQHS
jgi:hypothetical protein